MKNWFFGLLLISGMCQASPPAIPMTVQTYASSIGQNIQINYSATNPVSYTVTFPGLTQAQAQALVNYTASWLTQNVSNPSPAVYTTPVNPLWVRFSINWNGWSPTFYCYKIDPTVPPSVTNGWVSILNYWSNGQWLPGAQPMSSADLTWCGQ